MIKTVLCVDIGTTSLKAALVSADGEVVSFSSVLIPNPQSSSVPLSWYSCFFQAMVEIKNEITESKICCLVQGICVSGNGPTVVCENGKCILWNQVTKGIGIPEEADSSLFIPKILSLQADYPLDFECSKYIYSGPEYFIYQLTGTSITILPETRFESAYWNAEVLRACSIPLSKFPPFVKPGHNCGNVKKTLFIGLENDYFVFEYELPLFAGGPDFVVALIGTNTLKNGKLCDRCGSSEGFNFCVNRPVFDMELRTLPSVIPGLWNVSYLMPDSGTMSKEEKLEEIRSAFEHIHKVFERNHLVFPTKMAITGGQGENINLAKEKASLLGLKISVPKAKNFVHNELLGDACVAFTALGKYSSLQQAADHIVKEIELH